MAAGRGVAGFRPATVVARRPPGQRPRWDATGARPAKDGGREKR